MTTKEQFEATREARAHLTMLTLQATEQSTPTPTQEENDLLALGLMSVDDKAVPANAEMPPLGVQQAYMAAVQNPVEGRAAPEKPELVKPAPQPARRGNPEPIAGQRSPGRPPINRE